MKKKLLLIGLTVFAVLSITVCQTLITALDEPIVSLDSVELAGVSFNGANLLCKVKVENPNPFPIPFPEVGWEFFLNDSSFVKGTITTGRNQQLQARGSTIVEVPVGFEYLEVFKAITSLKGRSNAAYKVALAVKFTLPLLGEKVFPFEHEGSVPMPQVPKLSAPAMRVERADLSGATIAFSVNVENPNVFELPAPKIAFDYQVNRISIINSTTGAESNLTPNSTTPVSMRFSVSTIDIARAVTTSLFSASAPSQLSVSFDFGVPAFAGDTFNLNIPGTLPLR